MNKLTLSWSQKSQDLVSGKLTNILGHPISGSTVALHVDGAVVGTTTKTDSLGRYSFTYAFKQGTHIIWTTSGMTTSPKITITVTSVLANISLTPSATNVNAGQSVTFTGSATDGAGNPMPGVSLYVFEAVGTAAATQEQVITTAPDGTFSFSLKFNSAGTFEVDVANNTTNS